MKLGLRRTAIRVMEAAIVGLMGMASALAQAAPSAARRCGSASETAHGRTGLQERATAQRNFGEGVHGNDGLLRRLHEQDLHHLSWRRKRRELGKVCRRSSAEANGAQDDDHGGRPQSHLLRGQARGNLLLLPSQRGASQDHADFGRTVRHSACRRSRGHCQAGSRAAFPGSGSRQVCPSAWRRAETRHLHEFRRQGNLPGIRRSGEVPCRDLCPGSQPIFASGA